MAVIQQIAVLLLVVSVCTAATVQLNDAIKNTKVTRNIDVHANTEDIEVTVEAENTGSKSVKTYLFAIASEKAPRLAYIRAATGETTLTLTKVDVAAPKAPAGTIFYNVDLAEDVAAGATFNVTIVAVFTHTLKPFPTEIAQAEPQLIQFYSNLYFFSPYFTADQTTQVHASNKIEFYTLTKASPKDDVVEYGPFDNIEPFTVSPLQVHYENNSPFVTFLKMTKDVEVSHWGNVNIEDHYDVKHSGAALKGGFSRLDYQRTDPSKTPSFRQITAVLPLSAANVYYRDQIGNISTSHLRQLEDIQELELQPRYPMFGGWSVDFVLGYDQPASNVLSTDGSQYVLAVNFSTPFQQGVVDVAEVRVILPEHATDIQWVTPFEVDQQSMEVRVTYLDTAGRPVLVLRKTNLVTQHNQVFKVSYRFPKLMMFKEPLMIMVAFFLFFLASMAYNRLHLSISNVSAEAVTVLSSRSLRSSRPGSTGEAVNKLLSLFSDALSQLEKTDAVTLEAIQTQIPLLKDPKLGTIAATADDLLRAAKKLAKKADSDSSSKLSAKISDLERTLQELARS